jgi:alanine dehydrogenase
MGPFSQSQEELLRSGIDPALLTITQEMPARTGSTAHSLRIGVPKEITFQEKRVPLSPGAVSVLVAAGSQVLIETKAGEKAQFSDRDYAEAGAMIVNDADEVFAGSDIIVKIAPLSAEELEKLQPKQTLISAVHIGGQKADNLKLLQKKNITAIGFEFLRAKDGSIPLMKTISEIAGIASIQIASELLSNHAKGKGILLGGVTGVPPAEVVILGAGTVGLHACKAALAFGANVKVIDEEIYMLKNLEQILATKVYTAISQQDYIEKAITQADVVIGAAYRKGSRAPIIVTEEMVSKMSEGSVIIDVAIDQGGCIETSRITNHDQPTFTEYGVIHYCVPNIAARVPRTASLAISNVLGPTVLKIAQAGGVKNIIASNKYIRSGIYVYHRYITQRSLASIFNLEFMDIDLLHAAQL